MNKEILTEKKFEIEVSIRDARKANDIISDILRKNEYKQTDFRF